MQRQHLGFGDTFYLVEVFVKIHRDQHYLWCAVGRDGEIVTILVQKKRDGKAAGRFFAGRSAAHDGNQRSIVTVNLRPYKVAHRKRIPEAIHDTPTNANNRPELSHQPRRVRKQGTRRKISGGIGQVVNTDLAHRRSSIRIR